MRFPKIALFFLCFLVHSHRAMQIGEPDLRPVFSRQGLSAGDWSSIRNEYGRGRHAAVKVTGGYRARNYTQQWTTHFDGRGFTVRPDSGSWSWGLKLERYGFPGRSRPVAGEARVTSEKEKVRYGWGEIEEWYINDRRGLEHGFTLARRPEGATGHLSMDFEVRGDLTAHVAEDGRGAGFRDASGHVILTYTGLKAWDADGKLLPAAFEQDADSSRLRLTVEEEGARYPLTIDPIAQQAYLKASNTSGGDNFGFSVAVSGDTAVVGAYLEDSNATGVNGDQSNNTSPASGAVYVFVRNSGVWTQQAYLKASNTGAGDQFGYSVAISGDTLVVGAYLEDSNATGVNGDGNNDAAFNSGAAYVFVRSGTVWTQQAYLKASNTETNDGFGFAVSISGDTVVVGAPFEDSNAAGINGNPNDNSTPDSGAAYVFVRSGTAWTQQAYLKASNPGGSDWFGSAVSISGDTVVVGAQLEDSSATGIGGNGADNTATDAGAAYIFVRSVTTWSQQAYVKASNTDAGDQFGYSVSLSGDTAVIGARREDSAATGVNGDSSNNDATDSGAAYVFVRSGATWTQQAYLKASNPENGDQFGYSVALSGDTLVVGAPFEDSSATGINGDQLNNDAADSGAAYVFIRGAGTWNQEGYLKASNTDVDDRFGSSVSISGSTVIAGAPSEDSNATGVGGDQSNDLAAGAGAAYVFTLPLSAVEGISVTPSSGSGFAQAFQFLYSDALGVADFRQEWVWFTAAFGNSAANTCMLYYEQSSNLLRLLNDAGGAWLAGTPGANATLQNSQCSVSLSGATLTPGGNKLTLSLPLTFTAAFAGNKQVWMYASGTTANSGWHQLGTWSVPAGSTVAAVSVTPNSGTGNLQTFQFVYSDTAGAADLRQEWIWFTPAFGNAAANTCMLYYEQSSNLLRLINDAGTAWFAGTVGANTTLQNSQCSINLSTTTLAPSGNNLTLSVPLTFTTGFGGAKQIWSYGSGSTANSGWQQLGTWSVSGGGAVSAVSVTPNSGSGTSQSFQFLYSDTGGAADLRQEWVWFTPAFGNSAANTCMLYYEQSSNLLRLINDAATSWLTGTPGAAATLQNSQCSITLSTVTISSSGNNLTLTVPLTFTAAFGGTKQVWMYAAGNTANSGWQQRGSWTASATVSAVSVTPNTGSGSAQTFQFLYSDTAGAADLRQEWVWFTAAFGNSAANTCMLYYEQSSNLLRLINDAGTAWLTGTPGAAATLQNSQCSINLAATTLTPSGNNLTLAVPLTFAGAFAGAKQVWMYAAGSAANSGWQQLGSWTAQ